LKNDNEEHEGEKKKKIIGESQKKIHSFVERQANDIL